MKTKGRMINTDFLIIGGGPAGLSSALSAAKYGVKVLLVDDGIKLGGQLIKQTHKFFGSYKQFAGIRGIEIADKLIDEINKNKNITIMERTTIVGFYDDDTSDCGVSAVAVGSGTSRRSCASTKNDASYVINPKNILIATGASERMIPFKNNDLPGVYGAGAVQTLMNLYGVLPGQAVLMLGAGNIGLIVSYQLAQAGSKVVSVVEAASSCGGYWVHAAKIKRMGIPIMTNTTIVEALGNNKVEGAILTKVDEKFNPIPGTQFEVKCDTICLAVGLNPLVDLLWQAKCKMKYIAELGGDVPVRDEEMRTSGSGTSVRNGIYVAGDAAGIEEATSAMLEGKLVGLAVANSLGYNIPSFSNGTSFKVLKQEIITQLNELRKGETGIKIVRGLKKLQGNNHDA